MKESEQKYRQLFESAPVGIAIADLQGHVFDMNPAMKNISGFKPSKNKEFDFQNHYVSQKDRKHIRKKLLKDEPLHNVELTLKRKNGEQYTALMDIQKINISGKDRFLVIQRDISKLKQIQKDITETKNYLQNIINSAKECIIAIDTFQHITLWNTTAEKLTGLSAEQVLGKPIHELSVFESTQSFSDALKNLSKGYGYLPEEIIINSSMKTISIVQFSASPLNIEDKTHQLQGILFVGHDISKDSQRRGTLLDQTSYLMMQSTSSRAIQKFISLQLSGYQGICFTRGSLLSLKKDFLPTTPEIHLYDELISQNDSSDQPLQLIKDIIQQSLSSQKKTVFFIDRIDYLLIRFSFEQVLRLIYQITPLISTHQAILLVRVNPQLFEQQQLQFLQEELFHIPTEKIEPIELDEHMYKILRFIQNLNHKNIIVSYQKVGKRFSISKVTTKKRLDELQKQGLITIRIKGRMKSVHLTEKAQLLLKQK
jgi:PAS domain S-box-containing protein